MTQPRTTENWFVRVSGPWSVVPSRTARQTADRPRALLTMDNRQRTTEQLTTEQLTTMPTYQYEAMDHTGREVKDSIDASTQEEAQQLIRQKGFFVTKIAEKAKKAKKRASAKKGGRRQEEVVHDRQDLDQAALHVHPPALDPAGRRPADPPEPEDPRGPVQAGRAQERAPGHRRGHRERPDPLRSLRQAPQGVRPALLQHDQGRRGRRCPRSDPSAPGRLQGEVAVAQAADQVGHGLSDRGHLRRLRDRRLHPLLHHPQVRGDLQRFRRAAAAA